MDNQKINFNNVLQGIGAGVVVVVSLVLAFVLLNQDNRDNTLTASIAGEEYASTPTPGTYPSGDSDTSNSCGYKSQIARFGTSEFVDFFLDKNGNTFSLSKLENTNGGFEFFVRKNTDPTVFSFLDTNNKIFVFKNPKNILVDNAGNIYIADSDVIYKFSLLSSYQYKQDSGWSITAPDFITMTLDSSSIYVASYAQPIYRYDLLTPNKILATYNNAGQVWGISVIGDNVYSTDYFKSRVNKYNLIGSSHVAWGKKGTGDGEFQPAPSDIVATSSYVFVVDNDRVQKFDRDGKFITSFSGDFGSNGGFVDPSKIAWDERTQTIHVLVNTGLPKPNNGNVIKVFGTVGCGKLITIKDVKPDSPELTDSFLFGLLKQKGFIYGTTFTLDDNSNTKYSNKLTISIPAGNYSLTENYTNPETKVTYVCNFSKKQISKSNSDRNVDFDVAPDEVVDCTFTNTIYQ